MFAYTANLLTKVQFGLQFPNRWVVPHNGYEDSDRIDSSSDIPILKRKSSENVGFNEVVESSAYNSETLWIAIPGKSTTHKQGNQSTHSSSLNLVNYMSLSH